MQTTTDEGWRTHEVRVGFALTWVKTWPERGGFGFDYAGRPGGCGWLAGTRFEAVQAAREELRAADAERREVVR